MGASRLAGLVFFGERPWLGRMLAASVVAAGIVALAMGGYYFVVPLANKEHEASSRFFEWITGEVGRAQ